MKSSRNQNPFTKAWWWRFAQIDTNPYESALARKRLIVSVPGSMPPPQLALELCFFNLFRFFAKLFRPNIYASQTAKAPTKRAKKRQKAKVAQAGLLTTPTSTCWLFMWQERPDMQSIIFPQKICEDAYKCKSFMVNKTIGCSTKRPYII